MLLHPHVSSQLPGAVLVAFVGGAVLENSWPFFGKTFGFNFYPSSSWRKRPWKVLGVIIQVPRKHRKVSPFWVEATEWLVLGALIWKVHGIHRIFLLGNSSCFTAVLHCEKIDIKSSSKNFSNQGSVLKINQPTTTFSSWWFFTNPSQKYDIVKFDHFPNLKIKKNETTTRSF